MLIDLEWDLKYAEGRIRANYIAEFDTTDGGLIITTSYPGGDFPDGKRFRTRIADRVHRGVYWSYLLYREIPNYTKWEIEYPWDAERVLFNQMCDARDDEQEHERLRDLFRRTKTTYGCADNLQQIFRQGRQCIASPSPYVLQLSLVTQEYSGGWRWHKNGPYIGRHKERGEHLRETPEIDNIIQFEFHKLVPKNEEKANYPFVGADDSEGNSRTERESVHAPA